MGHKGDLRVVQGGGAVEPVVSTPLRFEDVLKWASDPTRYSRNWEALPVLTLTHDQVVRLLNECAQAQYRLVEPEQLGQKPAMDLSPWRFPRVEVPFADLSQRMDAAAVSFEPGSEGHVVVRSGVFIAHETTGHRRHPVFAGVTKVLEMHDLPVSTLWRASPSFLGRLQK